MDFDYKKILSIVKKKNIISRSIVLVFGIFLLAFTYNMFLVPNQIITGGVSGLGLIANKIFGWNPATFIFIANMILLLVSFIFLGKDKSTKTIVGSILYPLFISLTEPLVSLITPYIQIENFIIILLITSLLHGLSCGLIYKMGFTTGGSDIIMQIFAKYFKIQTGKASLITSLLLLACGGIVFGINKVVYAIIVIYISTLIIDKIIIGISDSKMFFIYTNQIQKVRKFVLNELNTGITFFDVEGGYSKESATMMMCVVPTRDYYIFKETVLAIDPNAFFVISDCYEVKGGVKRSNLPFINGN